MSKKIIIAENLTELSRAAAEIFLRIGRAAIQSRAKFCVALSGGSTPKSLFQTLASAEFRSELDWTKTFFFFGDERHVAPDAAESNYRMARENLFEPLEIPPPNVFRWRAEWRNAAEVALDYEKTLREFFQTETPGFDLILLGMGADGHTASLFPESAALTELKKLATENWVEKFKSFRLTLTFPLINNAANILFLAAGAEKAETVKTILEGDFEPLKFPAQAVEPRRGELFWLVDREAARLISGK